MEILRLPNPARVDLADIPFTADYREFSTAALELMAAPACHCVNYFACPSEVADPGNKGGLRLLLCIADDQAHDIALLSCGVPVKAVLRSLSADCPAFQGFEREMAENFGLVFEGHPWNKPLRTAPDDYPFYHVEGEEIHEVGVGPIHAGVIEPGHFRFVCQGEKVLHLEIMLGYQHRGWEGRMLATDSLLGRCVLAESLAGDTAVGHGVAFARLWESLCGAEPSAYTQWARALALELERIAIHTGDLSALAGDIAYQLANAVYGRLRTPIINFMQQWAGNRLGKTAVRPFYAPYALDDRLTEALKGILSAYMRDFNEMSDKMTHYSTVLARLERTGILSREQASQIGAVGMAAKASGLLRDLRCSHPDGWYRSIEHEPVVKHHGDVYSRTQLRIEEIRQSVQYVLDLLDHRPEEDAFTGKPLSEAAGDHRPQAASLAISLVEGWRGEICHCALTDAAGRLSAYKACDPSFHNWMGLALSVRGNEISDFPICNKSFNLSYAGHDL